MVYRHEGHAHTLTMEKSAISGRLRIAVDSCGATIPDDEIPAVISALQNYMSQRAKELIRRAAR